MSLELIHFNSDGSIDEVELTTQASNCPLQATKPIEVWRVCLLRGQVRTAADGPTE